MQIFINLSHFSPQTITDPTELKPFARVVYDKIKKECPRINWKKSYDVMGRYDVVDIVESDDLEQVRKTAIIIRHSDTRSPRPLGRHSGTIFWKCCRRLCHVE